MVWPALRSIIINGLYDASRKLERYMIMDVPNDVLEEVADITASAARIGVKVDWMDEVLGHVALKRKHLDLLESARALKDKLVELDHQRDEITQALVEIDAEVIYNNFSHDRVTNYPITVLRKDD